MASSLPSLQVRKGSAVNKFLGRLIEIMAEVGTRSSMTWAHAPPPHITCTYVHAHALCVYTALQDAGCDTLVSI